MRSMATGICSLEGDATISEILSMPLLFMLPLTNVLKKWIYAPYDECAFRCIETMEYGSRSSIRRFQWDRRPISTVWTWQDSAETSATLSQTPSIRTEIATGWSSLLRTKTTIGAPITVAAEPLAGGLTNAPEHISIMAQRRPSGLTIMMLLQRTSNLPACWWNSTNAARSVPALNDRQARRL